MHQGQAFRAVVRLWLVLSKLSQHFFGCDCMSENNFNISMGQPERGSKVNSQSGQYL